MFFLYICNMKRYYITSRTFSKYKGWSDWLSIGIINFSYPNFIFSSIDKANEKLAELNKFSKIDEDLGLYYEYKIIEQDYE